MLATFKQGLVIVPDTPFSVIGRSVRINLNFGEKFILTCTSGQSTFAYAESTTATRWVGLPSQQCWLYWDFHRLTGAVTYAFTTVQPTYGHTAPTNPADDHHWYDLRVNKYKVWREQQQVWTDAIRVFACTVSGSSVLGIGGNADGWTGSQVSLNVVDPYQLGYLVYGTGNTAIKRGDGSFFTTADVVASGIPSSSNVTVGSIMIPAIATSPLPRFTVVDINHGLAAPAFQSSVGNLYSVVEQDVAAGAVVYLSLAGIISNDQWDWSGYQSGTPLGVEGGQLISADMVDVPAIAVVVDKHTIQLIQPTPRPPVNPGGGGGGDSDSYLHQQLVPAITWTINHNLNKFPAVSVMNDTNEQIWGDIKYVNINSVSVTFSGLVSGKASLT